MSGLGKHIVPVEPASGQASTDMGNISHYVPGFHGAFSVPNADDSFPHHPSFTAHTGTDAAHQAALDCGKGMGRLALELLSQQEFANQVRKEFEETRAREA